MKRQATDKKKFAKYISDKNLYSEYIKNSDNSITRKQINWQNI